MRLPKTPKQNNTQYWDELRGKIVSKVGGLKVGEAVHCFGYDLLADLVGDASFFQVLLLDVTGSLPEKRLADWLEAVFLCVSYPDSRIWCNQVGSLAGSLQSSPVAAVSAGLLASDSRLYGPGTHIAGSGFIERALEQYENGLTIEEIVNNYAKHSKSGKPLIPGYIRPLLRGDERIPVLEEVTSMLGFKPGKHLRLAHEIHEYLSDEFQEGMNAMGYVVAFLCDQGIVGKDQYRLVSMLVSLGVLACYVEAADNPPESFFPLRCEDIDYQGKPYREVPAKN